MILMALLFGLQRSIFSGFKSQWMMLISGEDKNNKAEQSCNDKITISEKTVLKCEV